MRDIGYHFPDTSSDFKKIDSKILLRRTIDIIAQKGYSVGNIDSTICLQKPKIKDLIPQMQTVLAEVMNISSDDVAIKATTTEKLGFVGKEEGIAVATVLIELKTVYEYSLLVIILIVITSMAGFSRSVLDKYMFNAYRIVRVQYVRLVSHGFLHADWSHLLVNIFVMWSFGTVLIRYFNHFFDGKGNFLFIVLFFSSLISSLYSLGKEKDNPYYNSRCIWSSFSNSCLYLLIHRSLINTGRTISGLFFTLYNQKT